jgi:hypothetical protein
MSYILGDTAAVAAAAVAAVAHHTHAGAGKAAVVAT